MVVKRGVRGETAEVGGAGVGGKAVTRLAILSDAAVLAELSSSAHGLSAAEAATRLITFGPNAVRTHRARAWTVLGRQLRNPILILLAATVVVSLYLGDVGNSLVIIAILLLSVGLGFVTEYRAERASEELHSRVSHRSTVVRSGEPHECDVTEIVPGDIVYLSLGSIVPADLRLLDARDLECDESIITGESLPVTKTTGALSQVAELGSLTNSALMGTVVRSGSARGVVVATGGSTEFGRIALSLGQLQPQTDFQRGLQQFSVFLLTIALSLTTLIFIANLILQRPPIESLMFSLAIAVGMTPQLLPAVVSTGLAMGSRRLARAGVLVKRLVSIEDLGDIDVLVTDKTGTLTAGQLSFNQAITLGTQDALELGLLATDTDFDRPAEVHDGLSALDAALWSQSAPLAARLKAITRLDFIAFDHERRMASALIRQPDGATVLVCKGSAEDVLARCDRVPPTAQSELLRWYSEGARVIAVASRVLPQHTSTISPADETDLEFHGLLVFSDPPKEGAAISLAELAGLGIEVKIATGDNAIVAETVCRALGLTMGETLTGEQLNNMSDPELAARVVGAGIFARVSPEQKARILRLLRQEGKAVGFLGDGVNDAIALHDSDVGISVDSATDVAKEAADIVLMRKDLSVVADAVRLGRGVFSNTMKYVLMGTSGDFGNMFSAALGSVVLNFLPMLAGQVLLNDLLYDSSQLAIPGDRVDKEQVARPSHWNIGLIRKFMFLFGPISSVLDFATFGLMVWVFHASQSEFRSGWFVESLATETLIVFAVRTRRVPFFRSRPSAGLVAAVLTVVAIGCYLPYSPLSAVLGFVALPAPFFAALAGMIVIYLVAVEVAKHYFFTQMAKVESTATHLRAKGESHRIGRRAARFSTATTHRDHQRGSARARVSGRANGRANSRATNRAQTSARRSSTPTK